MARPITFLSDYGDDDEFAGVCRAVIARIAPEARVIDLTHGIARHDIRQGAAVLANALPFAPPGVHLAVVDPEVGTERRAVAVRVADEDRVLVGPDNGLLSPAIERLGGPRRGGRRLAVAASGSSRCRRPSTDAMSSPRWRRPRAGSDPARGRHAAGPDALTTLERAGRGSRTAGRSPTSPISTLRKRGARPRPSSGCPRPGSGSATRWSSRAPAGSAEAVFARTFADVGEGRLLLYVDSYGSFALAVNRGSAAAELRLVPGDEVVLRPDRMPSFGWPRRHFRVTGSTNERARELAIQGAPAGTVVTAEEQTSGRGRRGRSWVTPPGKALLYSAILRPLDSEHALLPLAVPLAVCEAVEAIASLKCRVKWPNDVWIEEQKVAGVLLEARPPTGR